MRTRLLLETDAFMRYVVAHYYGGGQSRASRADVRRFARAAVEVMAQDWSLTLRPRQFAAAQRLLRARTEAPETLDRGDRPVQAKLF